MTAELIVAFIIGLLQAGLMWQQNKILERQNEIFSRQENIEMDAASA